MTYPKEKLFTDNDFFTTGLLTALGVVEYSDLKYKKGAFYLENFYKFKEDSTYEGYIKRPNGYGGVLNISKNTLLTQQNGKTSPYLNTGFNAGHIIARQLTKPHIIDPSKKNYNNIFKQTVWANIGNSADSKYKLASWGHNQSYFENEIKHKLENSELTAWLQVIAIKLEDEKIPRGTHIQLEYSNGDTLNVFVPNVEVDYIIDYNANKKIKKD